MVKEEKYTPVQNMYKSYLSLVNKKKDFDYDLENVFDEIIESEKDTLKKFFVAGMFAKDLMNKKNIDLNEYFEKYYYNVFPDE